MFADATDPGTTSSLPNVGAAEMSSTDADSFDMFADDDDKAFAKPSSDGMNSVTAPNSNAMSQTASYTPNTASESKLPQLYETSLIKLYIVRSSSHCAS